MRLSPCSPFCAFVVLLAACGADPVPQAVAPVAVQAAQPATATPVSADPGLGPVAARLLDGTASTEDRQRAARSATNTVIELLAAAAAGDAPTQGRAPAAISALGTAALPGLAPGRRRCCS